MKAIRGALDLLMYAVCIGLIIGGVIEVWRAGLIDSAIVMALLLVCVLMQSVTIHKVKRDLERSVRQQGEPKP